MIYEPLINMSSDDKMTKKKAKKTQKLFIDKILDFF